MTQGNKVLALAKDTFNEFNKDEATWKAAALGKHGQKKEAFRRGEEGFFVFRGLSWSQGRNGLR